MFKKYVAVLLSGLMLVSAVSLTGCGNSSKDSDSGKSDPERQRIQRAGITWQNPKNF